MRQEGKVLISAGLFILFAVSLIMFFPNIMDFLNQTEEQRQEMLMFLQTALTFLSLIFAYAVGIVILVIGTFMYIDGDD